MSEAPRSEVVGARLTQGAEAAGHIALQADEVTVVSTATSQEDRGLSSIEIEMMTSPGYARYVAALRAARSQRKSL